MSMIQKLNFYEMNFLWKNACFVLLKVEIKTNMNELLNSSIFIFANNSHYHNEVRWEIYMTYLFSSHTLMENSHDKLLKYSHLRALSQNIGTRYADFAPLYLQS